MKLKQRMIEEFNEISLKDSSLIVVALKLGNGSTEIITSADIGGKVAYYIEAYDDDFRHVMNKNVQIVDYMIV